MLLNLLGKYLLPAACVGSLSIGAGLAWKWQSYRYSEKLEAAESQFKDLQITHQQLVIDSQQLALAHREQIDKAVEKAEAEAKYENKAQKQRVKVVTKLVEKPVYRNVCIDDRGVQLLAAQIDSANGERKAATDTVNTEQVLREIDEANK